jgi:hypothetical protein
VKSVQGDARLSDNIFLVGTDLREGQKKGMSVNLVPSTVTIVAGREVSRKSQIDTNMIRLFCLPRVPGQALLCVTYSRLYKQGRLGYGQPLRLERSCLRVWPTPR